MTTADRNGAPLDDNFFATRETCAASSAVGARTRARTSPGAARPSAASRARSSCTSGARYASVLPDPVWSASTTSFPFTIGPKPAACTCDGRSAPQPRSAATISSDAPSSANVVPLNQPPVLPPPRPPATS